MALPSQGGFSSFRGGGMYRRRRKRKGVTILFMLVVASGVAWLVWPDKDVTDLPLPIVEATLDSEPVEVVATPPVATPPVITPPVIEEPIERPAIAQAERPIVSTEEVGCIRTSWPPLVADLVRRLSDCWTEEANRHS